MDNEIKHCPLCDREDERITLSRHHLQTRRKSNNTADICTECHKAIHGLFTHQEIRDDHAGCDSVAVLRKHPEFCKTLAFIRKLRPGAKLKMSKRVGHTKYKGRKR